MRQLECQDTFDQNLKTKKDEKVIYSNLDHSIYTTFM